MKPLTNKYPAVAAALLFLAIAPPSAAAQRFTGVDLGPDKQLNLRTQDGNRIAAPTIPPVADLCRGDNNQREFSAPAISPDGTIAGWTANFCSGFTSYTVPLALVLYADGKIIRVLRGNEQSIWKWRFSDDSRRVAYRQSTVHGDMGKHFELVEIKTGKRVATYDIEPGGHGPKPPEWALALLEESELRELKAAKAGK